MPKSKEFDCVEMKNRIQRELMAKYEGLSDGEIREEHKKSIESDPILGPIYKRARVIDPKPTSGSE